MSAFRYRVYDPDTPRDLPPELVQEMESAIELVPGMEWIDRDGPVTRIADVDPDPDPDFSGRVYYERA